MTAGYNGENWVVIGLSLMELGLQVPTMVDNQSLTLAIDILSVTRCDRICEKGFPHTFTFMTLKDLNLIL